MEPWQGEKVLKRLLESYFGKRWLKILESKCMSSSCVHAVVEHRKKRYGVVYASMMHNIAESVEFTSPFGSNVLYFAKPELFLEFDEVKYLYGRLCTTVKSDQGVSAIEVAPEKGE